MWQDVVKLFVVLLFIIAFMIVGGGLLFLFKLCGFA